MPNRPNSGRRRRPGRSGFAAFLAFAVLIALSLGVFSYFTYMRQRRVLRYQQLFGEYNQHLARVGLNLARRHLEMLLREPGTEAFDKIVGHIGNDLTWVNHGSEDRAEIARFDIRDIYGDAILKTITSDLAGAENNLKSLEAVAYLVTSSSPTDSRELRPFPPWVIDGSHKFQNMREKEGRVYLEVTSKFKGAAFMSVHTVVLKGYYEFRVVYPIPPLVRHFTLLLSEPARGLPNADQPDALNVVRTAPGGILKTGSHAPVILRNGAVGERDKWGYRLDKKLLSRQGWVWLGKEDLVLNLVYDEIEKQTTGVLDKTFVGEDFQFFLYRKGKEEKGRPYWDEEIQDELALPKNDWHLRNWDMGACEPDSGYPAEYATCFLKGSAAAGTSVFDGTRQRQSSLFHCMGVGHRLISPTVVLGKVDAGFLRLCAAYPIPSNPGLSQTKNHYFCILRPAPDAADFQALYDELPPTSQPDDYKCWSAEERRQESDPTKNPVLLSGKLLFLEMRNPFAKKPVANATIPQADYPRAASGHRTRPYNYALLHLKRENQEHDPAKAHSDVGLPKEVFDVDDAGYPETIPADLCPDDDPAVEKQNTADLPLEQVPDRLKDPTFLTNRVSRTFEGPSQTGAFRDFLEKRGYYKNETLSLGATIIASGTVHLPPIRKMIRGGIIIADDIVVTSWVDPGPVAGDYEHLTLLATTGNIRLKTSNPCHASLIAPQGMIKSDRPFRIHGQVVARAIDPDDLKGHGEPSRLNYYQKRLKTPVDKATQHFIVDLGDNFVQVQ